MDLVAGRCHTAAQRAPLGYRSGGTVRVVAVEEGTAIIECALPGRRPPWPPASGTTSAAVPEITGIQFVGPPAEPPPAVAASASPTGFAMSWMRRSTAVIAAQRRSVCPGRGRPGWGRIGWRAAARVQPAEVTVRQGIEPLLRAHVPDGRLGRRHRPRDGDQTVLLGREAMIRVVASLGMPAACMGPRR